MKSTNRPGLRVAAVMVGLLVSSTANAELDAGWKKSFTVAQATADLGAPKPMLVVGAGQQDANPAAEALRAVYRQAPSAALVMDSSPIGDVAAFDDLKIVKQASKRRLPVERVAVVRVFPGSAAGKETAVVTVYDMAGKTLSAFTVERGKAPALAVPVAGAGSGAGVSGAAAGAVADVLHDQKKPPENKAALKKFYRKAVWFQDWTGINQYGQVVATWSVPMRGIQREQLNGADFYTAVDRPDLAEKYSRKNTIRIALAASGGALMAAGIGTMVWGTVRLLDNSLSGSHSTAGDVEFDYARPSSTPAWIATGVLFGGGLGVLIGGLALNPHPVAPDKARQLAIDYDVKLRKDLGLPPLAEGLEEDEGDDEEKPAPKARPAPPKPAPKPAARPAPKPAAKPPARDNRRDDRYEDDQDDPDDQDDYDYEEDEQRPPPKAKPKAKKRAPAPRDDEEYDDESSRVTPKPGITNLAIVPSVGPGGGGISASFQF